ncbi:regulator of telomere elongation helicase 1 homolog [Contarinia nasturtii]|uniref:regulator of telomere elongation helicase 1 homolog n=1 Tax=Contarinia nasturtii TaxID=265458 RepID=UPI0012D45178|nr:regulator of telomere elongation helicase 1 homolog [Contarinia nasturtii]
MQYLLNKGIRCFILTSGTLAPLPALIQELEIDIPIQLTNSHIIEANQVFVKVVAKGPDEVELDSTYKNRKNPNYNKSLGNTILKFAKTVPGGLLVFFTSYSLMKQHIIVWKSTRIWDNIEKVKRIFVEPQTKQELQITMNDYYRTNNDPTSKGAIFMAVMRGKVSEGLDFADNQGRGAIITGLPYAPIHDPRVKLKKEYLDGKRNERDTMSGNVWYSLDAVRAVNQAIGRIIRHKSDYGAILFCEKRFHQTRTQENISGWVRENMHTQFQRWEIENLAQFYTDAGQNLPKPAPKQSLESITFDENSSDMDMYWAQLQTDDVDTSDSEDEDIACLGRPMSQENDSIKLSGPIKRKRLDADSNSSKKPN